MSSNSSSVDIRNSCLNGYVGCSQCIVTSLNSVAGERDTSNIQLTALCIAVIVPWLVRASPCVPDSPCSNLGRGSIELFASLHCIGLMVL